MQRLNFSLAKGLCNVPAGKTSRMVRGHQPLRAVRQVSGHMVGSFTRLLLENTTFGRPSCCLPLRLLTASTCARTRGDTLELHSVVRQRHQNTKWRPQLSGRCYWSASDSPSSSLKLLVKDVAVRWTSVAFTEVLAATLGGPSNVLVRQNASLRVSAEKQEEW